MDPIGCEFIDLRGYSVRDTQQRLRIECLKETDIFVEHCPNHLFISFADSKFTNASMVSMFQNSLVKRITMLDLSGNHFSNIDFVVNSFSSLAFLDLSNCGVELDCLTEKCLNLFVAELILPHNPGERSRIIASFGDLWVLNGIFVSDAERSEAFKIQNKNVSSRLSQLLPEDLKWGQWRRLQLLPRSGMLVKHGCYRLEMLMDLHNIRAKCIPLVQCYTNESSKFSRQSYLRSNLGCAAPLSELLSLSPTVQLLMSIIVWTKLMGWLSCDEITHLLHLIFDGSMVDFNVKSSSQINVNIPKIKSNNEREQLENDHDFSEGNFTTQGDIKFTGQANRSNQTMFGADRFADWISLALNELPLHIVAGMHLQLLKSVEYAYSEFVNWICPTSALNSDTSNTRSASNHINRAAPTEGIDLNDKVDTHEARELDFNSLNFNQNNAHKLVQKLSIPECLSRLLYGCDSDFNNDVAGHGIMSEKLLTSVIMSALIQPSVAASNTPPPLPLFSNISLLSIPHGVFQTTEESESHTMRKKLNTKDSYLLGEIIKILSPGIEVAGDLIIDFALRNAYRIDFEFEKLDDISNVLFCESDDLFENSNFTKKNQHVLSSSQLEEKFNENKSKNDNGFVSSKDDFNIDEVIKTNNEQSTTHLNSTTQMNLSALNIDSNPDLSTDTLGIAQKNEQSGSKYQSTSYLSLISAEGELECRRKSGSIRSTVLAQLSLLLLISSGMANSLVAAGGLSGSVSFGLKRVARAAGVTFERVQRFIISTTSLSKLNPKLSSVLSDVTRLTGCSQDLSMVGINDFDFMIPEYAHLSPFQKKIVIEQLDSRLRNGRKSFLSDDGVTFKDEDSLQALIDQYADNDAFRCSSITQSLSQYVFNCTRSFSDSHNATLDWNQCLRVTKNRLSLPMKSSFDNADQNVSSGNTWDLNNAPSYKFSSIFDDWQEKLKVVIKTIGSSAKEEIEDEETILKRKFFTFSHSFAVGKGIVERQKKLELMLKDEINYIGHQIKRKFKSFHLSPLVDFAFLESLNSSSRALNALEQESTPHPGEAVILFFSLSNLCGSANREIIISFAEGYVNNIVGLTDKSYVDEYCSMCEVRVNLKKKELLEYASFCVKDLNSQFRRMNAFLWVLDRYYNESLGIFSFPSRFLHFNVVLNAWEAKLPLLIQSPFSMDTSQFLSIGMAAMSTSSLIFNSKTMKNFARSTTSTQNDVDLNDQIIQLKFIANSSHVNCLKSMENIHSNQCAPPYFINNNSKFKDINSLTSFNSCTLCFSDAKLPNPHPLLALDHLHCHSSLVAAVLTNTNRKCFQTLSQLSNTSNFNDNQENNTTTTNSEKTVVIENLGNDMAMHASISPEVLMASVMDPKLSILLFQARLLYTTIASNIGNRKKSEALLDLQIYEGDNAANNSPSNRRIGSTAIIFPATHSSSLNNSKSRILPPPPSLSRLSSLISDSDHAAMPQLPRNALIGRPYSDVNKLVKIKKIDSSYDPINSAAEKKPKESLRSLLGGGSRPQSPNNAEVAVDRYNTGNQPLGRPNSASNTTSDLQKDINAIIANINLKASEKNPIKEHNTENSSSPEQAKATTFQAVQSPVSSPHRLDKRPAFLQIVGSVACMKALTEEDINQNNISALKKDLAGIVNFSNGNEPLNLVAVDTELATFRMKTATLMKGLKMPSSKQKMSKNAIKAAEFNKKLGLKSKSIHRGNSIFESSEEDTPPELEDGSTASTKQKPLKERLLTASAASIAKLRESRKLEKSKKKKMDHLIKLLPTAILKPTENGNEYIEASDDQLRLMALLSDDEDPIASIGVYQVGNFGDRQSAIASNFAPPSEHPSSATKKNKTDNQWNLILPPSTRARARPLHSSGISVKNLLSSSSQTKDRKSAATHISELADRLNQTRETNAFPLEHVLFAPQGSAPSPIKVHALQKFSDSPPHTTQDRVESVSPRSKSNNKTHSPAYGLSLGDIVGLDYKEKKIDEKITPVDDFSDINIDVVPSMVAASLFVHLKQDSDNTNTNEQLNAHFVNSSIVHEERKEELKESNMKDASEFKQNSNENSIAGPNKLFKKVKGNLKENKNLKTKSSDKIDSQTKEILSNRLLPLLNSQVDTERIESGSGSKRVQTNQAGSKRVLRRCFTADAAVFPKENQQIKNDHLTSKDNDLNSSSFESKAGQQRRLSATPHLYSKPILNEMLAVELKPKIAPIVAIFNDEERKIIKSHMDKESIDIHAQPQQHARMAFRFTQSLVSKDAAPTPTSSLTSKSHSSSNHKISTEDAISMSPTLSTFSALKSRIIKKNADSGKQQFNPLVYERSDVPLPVVRSQYQLQSQVQPQQTAFRKIYSAQYNSRDVAGRNNSAVFLKPISSQSERQVKHHADNHVSNGFFDSSDSWRRQNQLSPAGIIGLVDLKNGVYRPISPSALNQQHASHHSSSYRRATGAKDVDGLHILASSLQLEEDDEQKTPLVSEVEKDKRQTLLTSTENSIGQVKFDDFHYISDNSSSAEVVDSSPSMVIIPDLSLRQESKSYNEMKHNAVMEMRKQDDEVMRADQLLHDAEFDALESGMRNTNPANGTGFKSLPSFFVDQHGQQQSQASLKPLNMPEIEENRIERLAQPRQKKESSLAHFISKMKQG